MTAKFTGAPGLLARWRAWRHDMRTVVQSHLFDAAWYRARHGLRGSAAAAARHYLRHGLEPDVDPGPRFSTAAYLADNPDVAAAGVNPLLHFVRHGWMEGRRLPSSGLEGLEEALWVDPGDPSAAERLAQRLADGSALPEDRVTAARALLRWHVAQGRPEAALAPLAVLRTLRHPFSLETTLLEAESLRQSGQLDAAEALLCRALEEPGAAADLRLALAGVRRSRAGGSAAAVETVSEVFRAAGLGPVQLTRGATEASLDTIAGIASHPPAASQPQVTVLVPLFDSADTLETALAGLLAQEWANLQILVIDDGSTQPPTRLARLPSMSDARVHVLERRWCEGPYAARNTGLLAATGEFITVHDADDWSHPAKIRLQVEHLLANPHRVACLSHGIRCTTGLIFGPWRTEGPWVEPNLSSLMFRRSALDRLGAWDVVRAGADTEFHHRLVCIHGPEAVDEVLPGTPLSFIRRHEGSLTASPATHIRTRLGGARRSYETAARLWHESVRDERQLCLAPVPTNRPFPVPAELRAVVREMSGPGALVPGRPTVLLCGHACGAEVFGAERCLEDVARTLAEWCNVLVALPEDSHAGHVRALLSCAHQLVVLPYAWWRAGSPGSRPAQANLMHLMRRYQVDLVYVNTVTLHDPLVAARLLGVPCAIHVHELPEGHEDLCQTLGADPATIRQHTLEGARWFVAPSEAVARWLDAPGRVFRVPNVPPSALFSLPQRADGPLRVAMISSNTAAKGLDGFADLARSLHADGQARIECVLVGPDTPGTAALREAQSRDPALALLRFAGPAPDPETALRDVDVVVNLSRVPESFGRTVVEAMAAARPVICHHLGALPELFTHGVHGWLVSPGDTAAVAAHVKDLEAHPEIRRRMGEAGREHARRRFTSTLMLDGLDHLVRIASQARTTRTPPSP